MPSVEEARKQAGLLLMVGIEGPQAAPATLELLAEVKPLGVILFARNAPDRDSLLALNAALQAALPHGLLAIDHEGGRVDRMPAGFTRFPPALTMSACGDVAAVRAVGVVHGRELRAAGFHINFAPVLDVHTNADNPVIGDRAFGTTPEEVTHFALPYLEGLSEGGVLGCGKHFPGHGDTRCDSHLELPVLAADTHSRKRLEQLEMRPFSRAIDQGIPMIMTAHVRCEALDAELPATLSSAILDGYLRRRMGFQGVIVSDDLEMAAVADHFGVGPSAVAAVVAGCDLCLVCRDPLRVKEAHAALATAIQDGTIGGERLAAVAKMRDKLLRRAARVARTAAPVDAIGSHEHAAVAQRFSDA